MHGLHRNEGYPPTPMMHPGLLYVTAATYLGGCSVFADNDIHSRVALRPQAGEAVGVPTPILAELNAQLQSHWS